MRLHAYVKNGKVHKLEAISETTWIADISAYEAIIDVEDSIPRPLVGWNFTSALQFEPAEPPSTDVALALQQTSQRLFGAKLAEQLTDKVGARNLLLSSQGNNVDVAGLLQSLGGVKSLLETGALKTARGIIASIQPAFPAYQDILAVAVTEITLFLSQNGWD